MWYLATNETDVFHYGELFEGAQVTTGQPVLNYFETQEDLIVALSGYGQEYIEVPYQATPSLPEE